MPNEPCKECGLVPLDEKEVILFLQKKFHPNPNPNVEHLYSWPHVMNYSEAICAKFAHPPGVSVESLKWIIKCVPIEGGNRNLTDEESENISQAIHRAINKGGV